VKIVADTDFNIAVMADTDTNDLSLKPSDSISLSNPCKLPLKKSLQRKRMGLFTSGTDYCLHYLERIHVILPGNSMCDNFDTVGSLSHCAESLLNEVFIHVWV